MNNAARLDELFSEALQRPPETRTDFVTHACGADVSLREDVLSLLAAADESGEFMAASAFDRLARDVARDGWAVREGDRVGAYTILRLLGSGSGGQVWCARDERLDRDVAIKMLLPYFASDQDRVRRFADEARLAGSLNHANVLAVYDVGEHGGAPFLVSERLEGETLRARLAKGSLPIDKAVAIALQIARGLAAAHARGILHRDLKPENVFLCHDGAVKILDFGVAKLLPSMEAPPSDTQHTLGTIVGTAGYMAPEQVTGARLDGRADLFGLGVIMFELLAGRRPFQASTTVEAMHSVLATDPPPLATLNPNVPETLAAVVHRLLEKNPEARFQSAGDLAWALERIPTIGTATHQAARTAAPAPLVRAPWMPWAAVAVVVGILAIATLTLWGRTSAGVSVPELTRFTWTLPAGITLDSAPAVSPDSRRVALVGRDTSGISRIFVRDRGASEPRAIAGTEGATYPFWSPGADSIGFIAKGKLMRVAVDGGAPIEIADAPESRGGASWGASGTIVFQQTYRDAGLVRVAASGGPVQPVTRLDVTGPDVTHKWPVVLPDGEHFLYLVLSTEDERRGVYLGSTTAAPGDAPKRLFRSLSGPVFVPLDGESGLLLSAEGRWIEARRFDTKHLTVVGDPQKIDLAAAVATPHHAGLLGASADILAFASTPVPYGEHVASVNSDGSDFKMWPVRELGHFLRLSPEGARLARVRLDPRRGDADIWVNDLKRGTEARITTSRDLDLLPVWSRDGNRVAYRTGDLAAPRLAVMAADGTGVIKTVACPRAYCEPTDWSPDGSLIVNASGGDVWMVPMEGSAQPRPIVDEPFRVRDGRVSSDGAWIAYVSDESGRPEVSVRSLSGQDRKFSVSTRGGDQPVWRRDGKELFYVNPEGFLQGVSVRQTSNGGLEFGAPRKLGVPKFGSRHWGTTYDVSADGGRVYFPVDGDEPYPQTIDVILGWQALVK